MALGSCYPASTWSRPRSLPTPCRLRLCRLPAETVYSIVAEAVELEREFCCEALSVALVGMNAKLMARVRRWHTGSGRLVRSVGRCLIALHHPHH